VEYPAASSNVESRDALLDIATDADRQVSYDPNRHATVVLAGSTADVYRC